MRKLFGLMAVVAALGLLGVIASGAGAEGPTSPESPAEASPLAPEGCFSNQICVYGMKNYENRYLETLGCGGSGNHTYPNGFAFQSATNRCGNKTNWLRTNGTVVACMNPGGNRPSPGFFNEVFIAAEFGSFC
jgi:hypothetical protein